MYDLSGDRQLTEAESNFADALTSFFQSLEALSAARTALQLDGGDELAAFLSTIPDDQKRLAIAQWPMLSMMLASMPSGVA